MNGIKLHPRTVFFIQYGTFIYLFEHPDNNKSLSWRCYWFTLIIFEILSNVKLHRKPISIRISVRYDGDVVFGISVSHCNNMNGQF